MNEPKQTKREKQILGERRARELRKGVDDESPEEIERRAKLAAEIKAANLFRKRLEGDQANNPTPYERRYKAHATVPDSRGRFG